jgi:hypothetical protein
MCKDLHTLQLFLKKHVEKFQNYGSRCQFWSKLPKIFGEDYYYRDAEQYNIAEFILAKHPEGKNGTAKVLFHYTPQGFLVYSDNT